ncbi:uncharacterized protein LOC143037317 [Oratosquilla oratoria]|uniref:uncharacterized protein LOC143037317 n=1 Tax=Oratosquilla oratoria TaxID=337810 RepID=UPI003F769BF1
MQPTSWRLPVSSFLSRGGKDVGQVSVRDRRAATTTQNNIPSDWHSVIPPSSLHLIVITPSSPEAMVPRVTGAGLESWKPSARDCTRAAGLRWSLFDVANTNRPERRTALVCKELARFNIDVAALSETRLPEEGNIREAGTGYTIFWKGKAPEEPRIHGVGFAIRSQLVQQHNLAPKAISERLMTVRIPITRDRHITLISVYAPTLTSPDEDKAAFYTQLDHTIQLVVLGDFNARVGKDHRLWEGIIGHHGIGNCNANGELLLGLCAEHQLIVTNTMFRLPNRQKTTWRHPRSKHWHILDYILTRARDRRDVRITRTMPGADDCWTDHRLVISRLTMTTLRPPRRAPDSASHRRFDCSKLRNPQLAQNFREACERHLVEPVDQANVEHHWATLRDAMTRAAEEIIGYAKKKRQDWFDESDGAISPLIEAKRQTRLTMENQPTAANKRAHKQAVAKCQRGIREAQNTWWQNKAAEIQSYADQRDLRSFYAATKKKFGPTRSSVGGLKDVDGATIITDSEGILLRWRSHFKNLLNDQVDTPDNLLRMTPQYPVRHWMALPPSIQDFNKALKRMRPGKAPGPDNVPLELLTHGGPELRNRLMLLILKIWETKTLPSDFRDATIVTIFKKGDRENCNNYWGILLLSIASKIFARILLDRLLVLAEDVLPESQCGFRPSRGTIDMIFCARQLQEKSLEQQQPAMFIFWDLKKAFDKVPRPAMWAVLARFGCPPDFVTLVRALHDEMVGRVCHQNSLSEPFPINGGLKQGCVLAPTCFSLYTAAMLNEIPPDTPSIDLRFRMDGGVFNLARLRARTKTTICPVRELQYADDNATPGQTAEDLQSLADAYNAAYERFGMQVNTDKTKILVQHPPGLLLPNTNTIVNGQPLEEVDQFTYLGSILTSTPTCKKDVENRIKAAHSAFGQLNYHALTMATKIMVFKAVVLSTLLYACETWTLYRSDIQNLERFQQYKLRQILNITWESRTTNLEVLDRASMTSVEATIIHHRLRWAGHVHRMDPSRLPKKMLYGELANGTRKRGAPKLRYKEQLKRTLAMINIDPSS